jgi:hypothetical protein
MGLIHGSTKVLDPAGAARWSTIKPEQQRSEPDGFRDCPFGLAEEMEVEWTARTHVISRIEYMEQPAEGHERMHSNPLIIATGNRYSNTLNRIELNSIKATFERSRGRQSLLWALRLMDGHRLPRER